MAEDSPDADRAQSCISPNSKRYHIDENDNTDIFVYRLWDKLEVTTQRKLAQELDKNPGLRCSKKSIPRGWSRIDVTDGDTFPDEQKRVYARIPKARVVMKSRITSIGLPATVYWRRLLMNHFKDLYIVSPESSPDGSLNSSSQPNSTETTPSSTFEVSARSES